jgi:hypothetical protein
VGRRDTLDHFAKMRRVGRARAGFRVADVDMRHCRAGRARFDAGFRDLFWRDRKIRMLVEIHVAAGHGAGNDRLASHLPSPSCRCPMATISGARRHPHVGHEKTAGGAAGGFLLRECRSA